MTTTTRTPTHARPRPTPSLRLTLQHVLQGFCHGLAATALAALLVVPGMVDTLPEPPAPTVTMHDVTPDVTP